MKVSSTLCTKTHHWIDKNWRSQQVKLKKDARLCLFVPITGSFTVIILQSKHKHNNQDAFVYISISHMRELIQASGSTSTYICEPNLLRPLVHVMFLSPGCLLWGTLCRILFCVSAVPNPSARESNANVFIQNRRIGCFEMKLSIFKRPHWSLKESDPLQNLTSWSLRF